MENNVNLRNNTEINEALKEFRVDKVIESQQNISAHKDLKSSRMVNFVIKHSGGLVKSEKQANYALFIFAIVVFAFSGYLFFTSLKSNKPATNVNSPNINQINKRVPNKVNR